MDRLEETRPTGHGRARGLVSGRVSGARVDARTFAPPADLAWAVAALWCGRWDLAADAPHTTRLLGDPCVHVVVSTGDDESARGLGEIPARLVGVWTRTWENTLRGRGAARAIKLRAGAAGALVPDASALRDRVTPLARLFAEGPALGDPDVGADADERILGALLAWLRPRLRRTPEVDLAIAACERLRADAALTRVDALAAAVGLGARALQRLFRIHVGAPPKVLLRRHRLQEAALRLERGDAVSLATLALDLGYADQAHFARDWKEAVRVPARAFASDVHRR